jgi:pyrroloquinoline quinone biosynthesis protein D
VTHDPATLPGAADTSVPRKRLILDERTVPVLPRYVRLHHDEGRGRWVMLAPERIIEPDAIALDVLQLCDGARDLAAIAEALASSYDAPQAEIQADIIELLQDLADRGYIKDNRSRDPV